MPPVFYDPNQAVRSLFMPPQSGLPPAVPPPQPAPPPAAPPEQSQWWQQPRTEQEIHRRDLEEHGNQPLGVGRLDRSDPDADPAMNRLRPATEQRTGDTSMEVTELQRPQQDQSPGILSRIWQRVSSVGDPEAEGAAAASTAMAPSLSDLYSRLTPQWHEDTYDPNRSFAQNALDPRAIENAMTVAMGVGPGAIKAYHGSPYNFERFDPSKIGTGEGAQAYGHGLYFAENPAVAEAYKGVQGNAAADPMANVAAKTIAAGHDAAARLKQIFPNASADEISAAIGRASTPPKGKMYEVNLNAEPQQFLDWDKPLSGQSDAVRRALGNVQHPVIQDWLAGRYPGSTGQNAYNALGYRGERPIHTPAGTYDIPYHDPAPASQTLNQSGIPGIRYLDQGSRTAGQGTSNYVVFDPSIIEILRKYGIIPPVVGAGLLGAAGEAAASEKKPGEKAVRDLLGLGSAPF